MGMHPRMGFPGQGMPMHPGQVNYGMPPPQFQYQVQPPVTFAAPPRPAGSVIVGKTFDFPYYIFLLYSRSC